MKSKSFYLIATILLIAVLGIRISHQGARIQELLQSEREEGFSFEMPSLRNDLSLTNQFTTENNYLAFMYPEGWTEIEDESIFELFTSPEYLTENIGEPEDYNPEQFQPDSVEEEFEDLEEKTTAEGDPLFIAVKSSLPTFSLGLISLQEIQKEESVDLKELIISDGKQEDYQIEIIDTYEEENYVMIESILKMNGRRAFRSKHLAFSGPDYYLLTFSSSYQDWSNFVNEFNTIISSIKVNEEAI